MKIIISPSKTMNYSSIDSTDYIHKENINPLTDNLYSTLINLDFDSLKTLYKCSDKIALEAIKANREKKYYKSIELFNGAVFKNLNYSTLKKEEKDYINNHLMIFSALYGIVEAKEAITPYRLDLNNSLAPHIVNLSKQWKPYINQYINNQECDYIIDLASSEYRKLIDIQKLNKPYIKIDFKDYKDNKYKTIGTFAKMARGQFLREMTTKNVSKIKDIKNLSAMNYVFNEELSNNKEFIFTR
ncbi:YaaA family protein [Clostridium sp. DL1XJH146]